jgi:hypothetical protein
MRGQARHQIRELENESNVLWAIGSQLTITKTGKFNILEIQMHDSNRLRTLRLARD